MVEANDQINQVIKQLQSTNANERYVACKWLKVTPNLTSEAIEALRIAESDSDKEVAREATKALNNHNYSTSQGNVEETKIQPAPVVKYPEKSTSSRTSDISPSISPQSTNNPPNTPAYILSRNSMYHSGSDEMSGRLETWALLYIIVGWVLAGLLLFLFFSTSCIDKGYSGCNEYHYNIVYIIASLGAIFQGYFVSTLLKSGTRVIDYLKWINERVLNKGHIERSLIQIPQLACEIP